MDKNKEEGAVASNGYSSYYLSCSRAGPKTKITLELQACLCTVECPKGTRKRCSEFKSVPSKALRAALDNLAKTSRAIPKDTYRLLKSQAKVGLAPTRCKKCGAAKLGRCSQEHPCACTVCMASAVLLKRSQTAPEAPVFLPVAIKKENANVYQHDNSISHAVHTKTSRFRTRDYSDGSE